MRMLNYWWKFCKKAFQLVVDFRSNSSRTIL